MTEKLISIFVTALVLVSMSIVIVADSGGKGKGKGKGRVYVGPLDKNVYCLNADSGKGIWKYETSDDVYSSPAVVI